MTQFVIDIRVVWVGILVPRVPPICRFGGAEIGYVKHAARLPNWDRREHSRKIARTYNPVSDLFHAATRGKVSEICLSIARANAGLAI